MKRIAAVLLVLLVLFAASPVDAQQRIGIFGGIATGRISIEEDGESVNDEENGLLSIVIGLTLQRQLQNGLVFAPEIMYVNKGMSDDDSDGNLKITYIEVPLLFRYMFETTGMIKPFITAGPEIAFQLSCELTYDDGDSESCDDAFGEDDSFKAFDAGLVIGGGITRDRLSFGIRYDMGLLNIDEGEGFTSKNRALMLLVGYLFQ